MVEEPLQRYFHDASQRKTFEENRETILEAYKELLRKQEKPTPVRLAKLTGFSRPTIYKHLKDIEKKPSKPEPEERSTEAFPYVFIEDFMSEVDDTLRKMTERIEKMNIFRFIFSQNLPFERADRIRALRPVFERRISQLTNSLTIRIRANKKSWFFEEEMQQQLMKPLIKMFYAFFYGLGLDKTPEALNCRITVKFNPLIGTMKFLNEQINTAEWRLANGRFQNQSGFEGIMDQLLKDHVEHYRLMSVENKTFNEKEFEEFKKNVLNFAKAQILTRIDREGTETVWSYISTSLNTGKRLSRKAATLKWKSYLRNLFDNYASRRRRI